MRIRKIVPYCTCPENITETFNSLCTCNNYKAGRKYIQEKIDRLSEEIKKITEDATYLDATVYTVEWYDSLKGWSEVSTFNHLGDAEAEIQARQESNPGLIFRIVKVTRDSEIVIATDDPSRLVTTGNLHFNNYGVESLGI